VIFIDKAPDALGGNSVGNSVPREMHTAVMDWPMVQATWVSARVPAPCLPASAEVCHLSRSPHS
jgi:hypothetical protein